MAEAAQTLAGADWLTAPATLAVLDALEAAGGAGCARFVGGCVRNTLMGRAADDIDIATVLTPDEVTKALKAARLRAVPTGVEHGTVTAISRSQPFEITTLRRDVSTDGRRAVVAFTTDWREDAERRDFTLNALYAGRDGSIFDPTGEGVADALAGRIVFVGEPQQRLREDYLRILRFFRFHAWYGRGEPDAAAVAACAALKDEVRTLAAERISKELLKLLAAADPRPAVALMHRTGVLQVVLPGALDLARFEALVALERESGEAEPVLRLAALLADDADQAAALAGALRLSNAERDRIVAALAEPLPAQMDAPDVRRAVYGLGKAVFKDRAKLAWARSGGAQWAGRIAAADDWTVPVFPLGGADVMAAGAPMGPRVGALLRDLETAWMDGDFKEDRTALLARLSAAVKA